ncbi:hydroxyproline-rich glycoprotein family protein [Abeliophyllum distichum]|uniref:Hydroxyproline-rich glycoprotein family protein n=1 Tax=Abeliophyllum distichum TaxID=126358 RepID=A0ABD1PPQ0_9LAMI
MGKVEDEQPLPITSLDAQGTTPNSGNSNRGCLNCSRLKTVVTFRCVFVLVLGLAVLLSVIFWLPFFHSGDRKDLDLDYAGHNVVASFMLKKPASFLKDYISQLQDDIFDEISFSTTKVEIISLQPLSGSNITKVVFTVDSDVTTRSLIRSSFVYLVTHKSFFHLSTSLFGDPFSFEVLKFKGGITASPEQKAFLLQKVQIFFNFTLNFSIDQILYNFDELSSQLKSGLHLTPYENLYISLTNLKGSTVAQPTIVQSRVVLAVGINPSKSRLKQLAKTITGSRTENLGLNNTVFGRVKQVRLSSVNVGSDGSGPSPSTSPSPAPSSESHHHRHRRRHRHHHHHHHHHHHDAGLTPGISPSPSMGKSGFITGKLSPASTPAPMKSRIAEPPNCHIGYRNRFPSKPNKDSHTSPTAPPVYVPRAAPSQPEHTYSPTPKMPPVPVASPLPNVAYAHTQPPSKGEFHAGPPDVMPLISSSPSPSSVGIFSSNLWALLLFLLIVLHL